MTAYNFPEVLFYSPAMIISRSSVVEVGTNLSLEQSCAS